MQFKHLRFLELTLFVLGLLLITAIFPSSELLRTLLALLFLNALFVTLSAVGVGPGIRRTLLGIWLVGTALSLAEGLLAHPFGWVLGVAGESADFLVALSGVVATLRYVLMTRRVSLDLIFAAVVAYLLLGIGFAILYTVVLTINPHAFNVGGLPESGGGATLMSQMIYFSFVTIATLGYGDIAPQLPLPRILAVFEAIIGQFYIAIVIAWLVSRYVADTD